MLSFTLSPRPMQTSRKRVLLIEDDPVLNGHLLEGLGEQGFDVTVAVNVGDAIAILRKESFAVVILDIVLGEEDGLAVLHHLRDEGNTVPVIVLSSHVRSYVRDLAAYFSQVRLLINKPCPINELVAGIATAIETEG